MPKRSDIKKILIIGSGPIVIGQACEFDYSGTQACKALREEGYEVVLINSNPATIMTDPETAHHTYIEPITPEIVAKVIERERPQAVLPTLGGQTGLNTAVKVAETGLLEKLGVEMIGASIPVIQKAEDREKFRDAMSHIGLRVPKSGIARSMEDARAAAETIGYPLIIRAKFYPWRHRQRDCLQPRGVRNPGKRRTGCQHDLRNHRGGIPDRVERV